MSPWNRRTVLFCLLAIGTTGSAAWGHAFPIRSEPRVGRSVTKSPSKITIWFDGELEPAFSTITVYDSAGHQVDKHNSHTRPGDETVLEIDLPGLEPGSYHVYWKVLAKDTHITEGDFLFTIEKK